MVKHFYKFEGMMLNENKRKHFIFGSKGNLL